jgi:hypothetical protein
MVPAKEPEPYQMITPDDIKEALIQTAKDEARMDRYRDEESRLLKDLRANPFPQATSFLALNAGLDLGGAYRALNALLDLGLVTRTQLGDTNPRRYIWEAKTTRQLEDEGTSF